MPSVLIIDDDDQVCGVLREAFEMSGFEVQVAHNGEEGTNCYSSSPSDVVILDILMPEKEGLETILELRRDFPTIKIIAISGGSERAHVNLLDLAQRLGAHHTVKKPFKMQEVVDLAKSLLPEPTT